MQRYTVYLYLETAVHVSGGTSTHHQERKQLYLQHWVYVTPLLLPAAIVKELELCNVESCWIYIGIWQLDSLCDFCSYKTVKKIKR
jgi:hypothetical protein